MPDIISDILSSHNRNKLRTFLTGFSMAWGVFMLVLLLGCGNGLKNAVMSNYGDRSRNLLYIWPGRTSKPFKGLQSGRKMVIDDEAVAAVRKQVPQAVNILPLRGVWGVTVTHGGEYISGSSLRGVTTEYFDVEPDEVHLQKGRLIDMIDLESRRKVMMLHRKNADILFKGKEALGEYVTVGNVPYKVIGIFSNQDRDQNPTNVIPLTTLEMIYPTNRGYDSVTILAEGVTSLEQGEEFGKKIIKAFSEPMQFDPEDKSALWMWNKMSSYLETLGIFNGISVFLWLIGIGTLIAGVVGISNIMLVTVRERTREFGVRKAIGARPKDIIRLILTESLMITSIFGYFGLLAGILVLEGLGKLFPAPSPDAVNAEPPMFANPEIDLGIAFGAIALLAVAGVIAAYIPAKRAVKVKPIEALHNEK